MSFAPQQSGLLVPFYDDHNALRNSYAWICSSKLSPTATQAAAWQCEHYQGDLYIERILFSTDTDIGWTVYIGTTQLSTSGTTNGRNLNTANKAPHFITQLNPTTTGWTRYCGGFCGAYRREDILRGLAIRSNNNSVYVVTDAIAANCECTFIGSVVDYD